MSDGSGADRSGDLEVERKWRLTRLPDRIAAFERGEGEAPSDGAIQRVRLRQGYLRPATDAEIDAFAVEGNVVGPIRFGRLRSIESADEVRYVLTVKSGAGLVRREVERAIEAAAFEAAWPATEGRRLEKTRWRVAEADGLVWEIDRFERLDLLLAEVEVADEAAAEAVTVPDWLAPAIDREVTREPCYTNAEIALRAGYGRS